MGVVFLCSMTFASDPFASISLDPSRTVLGNLFGSVDKLLPGSDGLIALLFRIFNVSILIFGSIFTGLIITQSVIQTASSGVFMGKKGSQTGYFTLVRTFTGLALVAPKASGYCAIQIFVMMVVTKSMTFAGNLSHEILYRSMLTPTDVLFNALPDMGSGGSVTALSNSKLGGSPHIQTFYKKVIKSSVCAVEYNRRLAAPYRTPSQLYNVANGVITFTGCPNLNLDFGSSFFTSSINPQAYQITLETSIMQLIDPIISTVFYNLPPTSPVASSAPCFTSGCSSGLASQIPSWLAQIKQSINTGHDSMASNFVLSLTPAATGSSGGGVPQDFLYNWLEFPVMYQAVMDVKGRGLSATSLTGPGGLLELAINQPKTQAALSYTSLAEIVDNLGVGATTGNTSLDSMIEGLSFAAQGATTGGHVNITTAGQAAIRNPWTGGVIQPGIPAGTYSDRVILIMNMENLLSQLMYGFYPKGEASGSTYTPGSPPQSLMHIWRTQDFEHFNEGAATFNLAYQRLQNRSASEIALHDPVNSYVYHTGNKWMETYLYQNSPIVLSPARKLGEVAAYISGQSTLFMFTVMRNVMADQVMRSYNIFWTFFATKIATGSAKALADYMQEQMWDWGHCLLVLPQPFAGTSGARHPICSPQILFLLVPVPNPTWPTEMMPNSFVIAGMTAANITAAVVDETLKGLFTYVFMLSSQYEYAYNGYIVMAAMPVMVISNLLAIWIPMLPSLIYFISIIGWIFAVSEAMIAAPLVVMGMTFPQGHDLLGSSQQAMVLLLSVFLRAPLIVFGFFMGMMILSVAMYALSEGLVPLALGMFGSTIIKSPSLGDGFLLYAFMVIVLYVTGVLLMQAVSLTYKLPNKILLWVGGQPTDGIEDETAQAIQGLVNQQQGSILQSIGQAAVAVKSASEGVSQQGASGGTKAGKGFS
jgi:hypothetical protein